MTDHQRRRRLIRASSGAASSTLWVEQVRGVERRLEEVRERAPVELVDARQRRLGARAGAGL